MVLRYLGLSHHTVKERRLSQYLAHNLSLAITIQVGPILWTLKLTFKTIADNTNQNSRTLQIIWRKARPNIFSDNFSFFDFLKSPGWPPRGPQFPGRIVLVAVAIISLYWINIWSGQSCSGPGHHHVIICHHNTISFSLGKGLKRTSPDLCKAN